MTASPSTPQTPPGPDGLPVVGSTYAFARDRLGFVTRMAREYGDVVKIEFTDREFYELAHPDHVRYVLVENNDNYVKGDFFQRQLGLLGNGLLNSEGEFWRRQRHLIEPAFHPDRIAGYAGTMTDYTERTLDGWTDGEVRNVHGDMMRLTLEIVAKALFDVDIREDAADVGRALGDVMEHFRRSTSRPIMVPEWLPTADNRRYRRASETLDSIVGNIVRRRRRNDDAGDVVSMLLRAETDAGVGMSDDQLRDEVLTLLLAGHETTAQALTFTWYLLATHPTVERRLHEELAAVLGGRAPTVEDLDDLPYTEQVVRESMRLYPPVHGITRQSIEADTVGGYHLPAGAQVGLFQWVVHRDPRFYEDPAAFQPERWTDSFRSELHPFAYFPFSGGPRRCVGDRFALLEARLVLATMAQRVHLEALPESPLELAPAITLRPKGGLRMRVHER